MERVRYERYDDGLTPNDRQHQAQHGRRRERARVRDRLAERAIRSAMLGWVTCVRRPIARRRNGRRVAGSRKALVDMDLRNKGLQGEGEQQGPGDRAEAQSPHASHSRRRKLHSAREPVAPHSLQPIRWPAKPDRPAEIILSGASAPRPKVIAPTVLREPHTRMK